MVKDPDEVEEITDAIIFDFMPDYVEVNNAASCYLEFLSHLCQNRVLVLSEWMGLFARLLLEKHPTAQNISDMRRAVRRVRPPTERALDSTPIV
jgi:hypothetical protein